MIAGIPDAPKRVNIIAGLASVRLPGGRVVPQDELGAVETAEMIRHVAQLLVSEHLSWIMGGVRFSIPGERRHQADEFDLATILRKRPCDIAVFRACLPPSLHPGAWRGFAVAKKKGPSPMPALVAVFATGARTARAAESCAYRFLLAQKLNLVIASYGSRKSVKWFAVTKERAIHQTDPESLKTLLLPLAHDVYYSTSLVRESRGAARCRAREQSVGELKRLVAGSHGRFTKTPEGFLFGTIAVRSPDGRGFATTGRGKKEANEISVVLEVDHEARTVIVEGKAKATLNAPLLDTIFGKNPTAKAVLHFHTMRKGLPVLPYAPPGTARDSLRKLPFGSFNIGGHGCFLVMNKIKASGAGAKPISE